MAIFQYFNRAVPIVVASLLVYTSVLPAKAQPTSSNNNCRDDDPTEVAALATAGRHVSRQQDRLTIATPKQTLVFRDRCNSNAAGIYATYSLRAYYRDLNYFLVGEFGNEWGNFYLIDGRTGTKTQLPAEPIFSPDRQRFASMMLDNLNGDYAVYIYRLNGTGAKLEYKDTSRWRPTNPIWRGNNSIEFFNEPRPFKNSGRPGTVLLERKGRVWTATQK